MGERREIEDQELGKMPTRALTDLIVVLLHEVVSPRHRCHVHRGGRCHLHMVVVTPGFKVKLNAHSMCVDRSSLHTYRIENKIQNNQYYNI
jgi:hypothetical protein